MRFRKLIVVGVLAALAGGGVSCASLSRTRMISDDIRVDTIRLGYTNSFLIRHKDAAVLIDTGRPEDAPLLAERLRGVGQDPAELSKLILTHAHYDHAGGLRYFQDEFGVEVIAGAGDKELLATGEADELCPTDRMARRLLAKDGGAVFEPITEVTWVSEAVSLQEVAGIPGRIVPLPGHTPGSLVVIVEDSVFVGDLFRGAITSSKPTTHFYMCDLEDNRADIGQLLDVIAPDAATFYPAHFGEASRAQVRREFLED